MAKIGIVLSGAASKGAYEIGFLRAIEEYFGMDSIKCVSSASIGCLVAQNFGMGKDKELEETWRNLDPKKYGRMFLAYSGNKEILDIVCDIMRDDKKTPFEHYVSAWNYSQHRVEYVPFHKLSNEKMLQYIRGAVAIPLFSTGEIVDGDRILDGAFLDNIPVYPLLDKDVDYIFCIYFDNYNYFFENAEFDKKVIKLFDFPNEKMLELMAFRPDNFDEMVQYGYDYTMKTIKEIFVSEDKEEIYKAIENREKNHEAVYKPRLTADIVLNNINVMAQRYSKRLSKREKRHN